MSFASSQQQDHRRPAGFAPAPAMARAAGYAHVHDFSQLANFEQQAAHVLKQDGPVFATLHVEPTKPLTYDYPNLYDPARRKALKAALQQLGR